MILGVNIQPSEFLKPAFVILIAWLFGESTTRPDMPANALSLALLLLVVTLLVLQPDFGQTMLVVLVWGALFFMAGMRMIWVFGLAGIAGVGLTAAYYTVPHVARRIQRFLDPASGDTFNIDIATESFMRGGWFGRGPGEGTVKRLLPESHTDFVFSVAAEEFGVVLCLVLAALYAFIVLRALVRAMRNDDAFTRFAAAGLAILFGLQSAINMAVNLHLIPAKGMTLPFISYGGSSMLSLAYAMGMLLALTREQPRAHMLTRKFVTRKARLSLFTVTLRCEPHSGEPRSTAGLWMRTSRPLRSHLRMTAEAAIGRSDAGAAGSRRNRRSSVSGRSARYRACRSAAPRSNWRPTRAPRISNFPPAPFTSFRARRCAAETRWRWRAPAALLALGTAKAWALIGRIRPAVVVGFGGYPTVPPLLGRQSARRADRAARAERRHGPRQPAAGRRASPRSPPAFRTLAQLDPRLQAKITFTGNPVRPQVIAAAATPYAAPARGRTVAPAGVRRQPGRAGDGRDRAGGDRALAAQICARACRSCSRRAPKISTRCARPMPSSASPPNARRSSPICRRAWRPPISIVSRSGASTVAELSAIGRPAILVPLPHALDQDQFANAGVLEEAGGAIRIEQRDFTPERLAAEIAALAGDPARLAAMAAAAKSAGTIDAAERLADLVMRVAGI